MFSPIKPKYLTLNLPPLLVEKYQLGKLRPFLQMYSEAIPNFYKFINSVYDKPLSSSDMWTYKRKRFHQALDKKIRDLAQKGLGDPKLSHSKAQFRVLKKPKPTNKKLIQNALCIVASSSNPNIPERAQSFPSQRTKRDRCWFTKTLQTETAIRTAFEETPSLRVPHFKCDTPVLTQMIVVHILKSENLDPNSVRSELDKKGCSNCIRHVAKVLLSCFSTSVYQKWTGLATRIYRSTFRKPERLRNAIRNHFQELKPSKSQIRLDPLFWFNQWCVYAQLFNSLLNFKRKINLKYSEAPRAVSLRFDANDLNFHFQNVNILKEIQIEMNLDQTVSSIVLTKYGQFRIMVVRAEKVKKKPNTSLLSKYRNEIERVLNISSSRRSQRSINSSSKHNFTVVAADPGQKNLFEGVTLNFSKHQVQILPFRLSSSQWRQLSGTADLTHAWNQAFANSPCSTLPVAKRMISFHRYEIRKKKQEQRALDTVLEKNFKVKGDGPIFFVVGDWMPSTTTFKGHPTSASARILKRISSKVPVLLQNEKNTTKLCSCCSHTLKNVSQWAIPRWFLKKTGLNRLRNWIRNRRKRKKSTFLSAPPNIGLLSLDELIQKCTEHKSWDERLPYISSLYQKCGSLFGRFGCFRSWIPLTIPQKTANALHIGRWVSHDVKQCPKTGRLVARDYDAAISIGVKFLQNFK